MASWNGLAGEATVFEVDEKMLIAEKVCPEQRTRNICYPEVLEDAVTILKGNWKAATTVRTDYGAVGGHQVRGTGKNPIRLGRWKD